MIIMLSKYDNMHVNGMLYALIYITNLIITSIGCMLLTFSNRNMRIGKVRHMGGINWCMITCNLNM